MIESAHLVGFGGALGAVCRYWVGQAITTGEFPWSTLLVNVLGSFILGILLFSNTGESLVLFAGVGFCGAFTTFSSFSVETVQLWDSGYKGLATLYAVANITVSVVAIGISWLVVG